MFVHLTESCRHASTIAVYFYGAPPARWHRDGIDLREAPHEVRQDKALLLFLGNAEYMSVIPTTTDLKYKPIFILQSKLTAPVSTIPLTKGGTYAKE
jgi:hypothetical protein